jgi:hypothetical protein
MGEVSPLFKTTIFRPPPYAGFNTPKKIPGKISYKLEPSVLKMKIFQKFRNFESCD